MSDKLVTVFKGWTVDEAHLIRARLEAANFHPSLAGENAAIEMFGGFGGGAGGVLVQVPEDEAEEAKAFLASGESAAS